MLGTPVVLWHGMGDTCCYPFSMGHISDMIKENTDDNQQYVLSLKIGDSLAQDTINGFLKPVNEQVEMACQQIANDVQLKNGYHAVGFSQGGQFLRAVAQRCPDPPMKNLITIGAQHQGVYGFPKCPGEENEFCDNIREFLTEMAYIDKIQQRLVQAQYWHDPIYHDYYVRSSVFLAEINNERDVKNISYVKNLESLDNFVMVKHNADSMVEPVESEHFGFYAPGSSMEKIPMEETQLYKEDWIGLKSLNERGKIAFLELDGDHLEFSDEWFIENIVDPYLNV